MERNIIHLDLNAFFVAVECKRDALPISLALSVNKLVSKVATGEFKPNAEAQIAPGSEKDSHVILRVVHDFFNKLYNRRMLRLVGVRLSGLVHGNYQICLFDDTAENINLYQSIDHIKHKYGVGKLIRANTIDVNKRVRMESDMFKANIK